MAWSYAVRLRDYHAAPPEPGVYEIGFTRGGIFSPIYVGKAEESVRKRLSAHYRQIGNRPIAGYLSDPRLSHKNFIRLSKASNLLGQSAKSSSAS